MIVTVMILFMVVMLMLMVVVEVHMDDIIVGRMRVRVAMWTATVGVTMMTAAMIKCINSYQIDDQTQDWYNKQSFMFYFWWFY